MPRHPGRRLRSVILGVCVLATGVVVGPQSVQADAVDDALAELNQVISALEALEDELGQLDEDYLGALDRKEELEVEIAASQARVDEMSAKLGNVEMVLQTIALKRYTSGDSLLQSPIFSNAAVYSAADQRSALSTLAINTGEGDIDDLQSVVDDLAAERDSLARKQEEQTQLIASMEEQKVKLEELEDSYKAQRVQAERKYGAKLRAAEEVRAAAAAARAQRTRNGGGGGGGSAAPRGGGGGGGYTGNIPQVSGSAGIAVQAAYSQIGVGYRYAAEEPGVAFDCSGLTKWAWGRAGVSLPHQSRAQYNQTAHVPIDQVQPGDLLFYYSPIGHVGIYVGNGQLIHAYAAGKPVELGNVNWNKVVGVGRPG